MPKPYVPAGRPTPSASVRAGRSLARLLLACAALCALAALGGCPRDPDVPPPAAGPPCATVADCNEGRTCGRLAACVDQRCERDRSLEVPCSR